MTWKDTLELGLKEDALFGRSTEIPLAHAVQTEAPTEGSEPPSTEQGWATGRARPI